MNNKVGKNVDGNILRCVKIGNIAVYEKDQSVKILLHYFVKGVLLTR
jgi:hypothetical protein